jgi:hypothetical protein
VDGLSAALSGVLARALLRDPEARFQRMDAFATALADPDAAVARGEVQPGWIAGSQPALAAWSVSLDEPHSWRDWVRYIAVALATIFCLVLIGLLAAVLRPGQGP